MSPETHTKTYHRIRRQGFLLDLLNTLSTHQATITRLEWMECPGEKDTYYCLVAFHQKPGTDASQSWMDDLHKALTMQASDAKDYNGKG